jgi:hypothetical protein
LLRLITHKVILSVLTVTFKFVLNSRLGGGGARLLAAGPSLALCLPLGRGLLVLWGKNKKKLVQRCPVEDEISTVLVVIVKQKELL